MAADCKNLLHTALFARVCALWPGLSFRNKIFLFFFSTKDGPEVIGGRIRLTAGG